MKGTKKTGTGATNAPPRGSFARTFYVADGTTAITNRALFDKEILPALQTAGAVYGTNVESLAGNNTGEINDSLKDLEEGLRSGRVAKDSRVIFVVTALDNTSIQDGNPTILYQIESSTELYPRLIKVAFFSKEALAKPKKISNSFILLEYGTSDATSAAFKKIFEASPVSVASTPTASATQVPRPAAAVLQSDGNTPKPALPELGAINPSRHIELIVDINALIKGEVSEALFRELWLSDRSEVSRKETIEAGGQELFDTASALASNSKRLAELVTKLTSASKTPNSTELPGLLADTEKIREEITKGKKALAAEIRLVAGSGIERDRGAFVKEKLLVDALHKIVFP